MTPSSSQSSPNNNGSWMGQFIVGMSAKDRHAATQRPRVIGSSRERLMSLAMQNRPALLSKKEEVKLEGNATTAPVEAKKEEASSEAKTPENEQKPDQAKKAA